MTILSFALLLAAPEPPLLGAIRWDAWHGDLDSVGQVVQRTLRPEKYRFRLPWFAEIVGDTVSIRCDKPGVIEREVEYARRAGLDYWAFVTYPEDHALSIPLHQFVALPDKQGLRFCQIVEWARFGGPGRQAGMIARLVRAFADPAYLRVLDGRPVLYLLCHDSEHVERHYGSQASFAVAVTALRAAAAEAGVADPYVVVMQFRAETAESIRAAIGADGISSYAMPGGTAEGEPARKSLDRAAPLWDSMAAVAPMIPLVSLGWDPRPRVDHPVPWHQPGPNHYETFTPGECAEAMVTALDWIAAHPEACPANALITYAWNEHDEGGWLCPTRGADGQPDDSRVEAVGTAVRTWMAQRGL